MKILQINSVYAFGSTGRITQDLKDVIEKYQGQCAVIYGRGDKVIEDNVFKIGNDLDVRFHVIYTRLTDKTGFASSYHTKKMIAKIQEYDPDLIHLHNIHGYYVNIELLFNFLKEYNKPVVWTLHDCWAFTGHCTHYDAINCQKWQIECNKCPQINEYPKSFYDNSYNNFYLKKEIFTAIQNMYLVTPSQWLSNEVKKSFLKTYPCYLIANGIDLEKFSINKNLLQNVAPNKLKILGVASVWGERKGFNDFIQLAKIINLNEYEIIMVGVNSKQKKELENNGIIAIERTNSVEELVSLYQQADVFFNPTYEDNFPTTNLEALACGTPVLTYKTGGSPESLTDNCGVVVEKGDLDSVIFHLKRWKTYNFCKDDCIKQAKKFDKFLKFNEYYQLYTEILSNIHK